MAITHRKGNIVDFDPAKMLPAEWAFPNDGTARYCVAPGVVKTVATVEELQAILTSSPVAYAALQQLLMDLENNPSELTNILNSIASLQSGKLDKTGNAKDNITTFTESSTDTNIVSGEKLSVSLGKILKSIKTFRTNISNIISNIGTIASLLTTDKSSLVDAINELFNNKLGKSSLVHTTEVNDTTKPPSTAVTYSLAQTLGQLNDNLAKITIASGATYKLYKSGNVMELCLTGLSVAAGVSANIVPSGYRPSTNTYFIGADATNHQYATCVANTSGEVTANAVNDSAITGVIYGSVCWLI